MVILLTANRYYALHGVRRGARMRAAARRLRARRWFRIGVNRWYLISDHGVTDVLKVRRGIVQEIGVADRRLTGRPPR